jgi:hypothetical protein
MSFSPEDRRIFRYLLTFPGGQQIPRYADPIAVKRNLHLATGGRLNKLIADANKDARSPDDPTVIEEDHPDRLTALQARGQLAHAVCLAFELPRFDSTTGEGMVEEECMALLVEYLNWLGQKKTSGGS